MTTSTVTAAPSLTELTRTREGLERQVTTKRTRLAALPELRHQARRARDRDLVDRLDDDLEDLPGEIGALEEQLTAAREREQQAREREFEERDAQAKAAVAAGLATSLTQDLGGGLQALARGAGKYRREVERFAEVQSGGDPERRRQLIEQHSGAGNVAVALEAIAGWLRVHPAVTVDLALLDRITGAEGATLRLVRDAFFQR